MKFSDYQKATEETAIYPDDVPESVDESLVYVVLGLQGESGEVAEKLKKAVREDDESYIDGMRAELGDVLWYLARVCEELDTSLEEVASDNLDKLLDRKERDVLEGEGDTR